MNAAVVGPARIGEMGTCPDPAVHCPSCVGFNAVVDGAIIQKDAMVLALARVARGVTIPSGLKVLPGKFVRNQAEVATDTEPATTADRAFMEAVIEVNTEFAVGYTEHETEDPTNVYGINFNPQTPATIVICPLGNGRIRWSTYWRLCWDEYPGAIAYELQAITSEGISPRVRRQSERCWRLELIAGENDTVQGLRNRELLLALQAGQLAYRVRAVLDGHRISSWSLPQDVGRATVVEHWEAPAAR